MKKINLFYSILLCFLWISCNTPNPTTSSNTASSNTETNSEDLGQAGVQDDESQKDIVKVAVGSQDHTTLVAALKQAEYVNDIANAGPFTVFAPTNAAFDKLPSGTVDGLMKPDQKDALKTILEYHVAVGVYKQDYLYAAPDAGRRAAHGTRGAADRCPAEAGWQQAGGIFAQRVTAAAPHGTADAG